MPTLKRAFDVTASCVGLPLAAFVALPVAVAMAIDTHSFPIFRQKRVGKDGKPFMIYKIKTMKDEFDDKGQHLSKDERTSKLARAIRTSRLDEICQVVNVIKGDMSLVGPRPFTEEDRAVSADPERQSAMPGMTGLAQVAGNNSLKPEEVLACDHVYVRHHREHGPVENLIYDIGIIAATPAALFANQKGPHYRK